MGKRGSRRYRVRKGMRWKEVELESWIVVQFVKWMERILGRYYNKKINEGV